MNPQTYGTTVAVALALVACPRTTPPDPPAPDGSGRPAVLANLGANVVLPAVRAFVVEATALEAATGELSGALAAPSVETPAKLAAARAAFKATMAAFQELEAMQFGPAGATEAVIGGLGLREELYSWPLASPCRVDQELVARNYPNENFVATQLPNAYGLAALEYLLFRDDSANACSPSATINSSGSWAALSAEELARRRADYGHVLAAHVEEQARRLADAWEPASGDFAGKLARAGDGVLYASSQEAIDEVFASLSLLDRMTKSRRLAIPAGIEAGAGESACLAERCPDLLESRRSALSKENVRRNLLGSRRIFLGHEPGAEAKPGFDDLLVEAGAPDLATRLASNFDAAIVAVEAIPGTLEEALTAAPESVRAAHAAIKAITDDVKSQLVTVLNLRVPDEGGGDND